jgi:hypothetical protein
MSSSNYSDVNRNPSQEPKSSNTALMEEKDLLALPSDSLQVRVEKAYERVKRSYAKIFLKT